MWYPNDDQDGYGFCSGTGCPSDLSWSDQNNVEFKTFYQPGQEKQVDESLFQEGFKTVERISCPSNLTHMYL